MILVIFSQWPTQIAPYLTELFIQLDKRYKERVSYYMLGVGDIEFEGFGHLKEEIGSVLRKSEFRIAFHWRNTGKLISSFFYCLFHFRSSVSFVKICLLEGLTIRKALGQLVGNYKLLNKSYELVYFNAIQTTKHFTIRGFFPEAKVLISSRGQDFDFEPGKFKNVLERADHIHVLGSYLKKRAIEEGFTKEGEITIIPPAILPANNQNFPTISDKSDDITIITAARIFWSKGYSYGLRAIAFLYHDCNITNIRYIIIGDGPQKDEILFEIQRLNLSGIVLCTGWLSQNSVDQYLANADIYLLPSIEEGFNNSVLQAQQFGLPCVVSDAGGLPENVLHEVSGLVASRYDVLSIANCLRALIEDNELRNKMSLNATERVVNLFALTKQVDAYDKMFQSVI